MQSHSILIFLKLKKKIKCFKLAIRIPNAPKKIFLSVIFQYTLASAYLHLMSRNGSLFRLLQNKLKPRVLLDLIKFYALSRFLNFLFALQNVFIITIFFGKKHKIEKFFVNKIYYLINCK